MEDAATAEISRSQIWQWIHNGISLEDGRLITKELVIDLTAEEVEKLGDSERYKAARETFIDCAVNDQYLEFLTLPAYEKMN
jgi:malate synthase